MASPGTFVTSQPEVDEAEASGILSDVIRKNNVFLGGASMGKGLRKAARYYIRSHLSKRPQPEYLKNENAVDLNSDALANPVEDSFYVVDLGIVVSQFYQWRKNFPRVEPFYAVKCNPDPIIVRTLAILGANFDCASRGEIRLVQEQSKDLTRQPEIIYANPCKARAHLVEAVCRGVRMVTFDNVTEVSKCAAVSKKIKLVLRIVTDDRGSQCRLSSKFGAPRNRWRPLLAAAHQHGLDVVGVSFHVGSGCRDASRYELALKDAREIFDMAKKEYGFHMNVLDIGGGFPGETHSMWNPANLDPTEAAAEDDEDDVEDENEGLDPSKHDDKQAEDSPFMFFDEIAERVSPFLDKLFPEEYGVRLIGEPGRYFVAACSSLVASVISARTNALDDGFEPCAISNIDAATSLNEITREEERAMVRKRGMSFNDFESSQILDTIVEEMNDYSKLYAMQNLAQQESDVYNDKIDFYNDGYDTAIDALGAPDKEHKEAAVHSVEGMNVSLVAEAGDEANTENAGLLSLAAAGEAAVNGIMMQAVADSAPLQDDYAYYINDGVYGAFNNIMFDHASVRPRLLRHARSTTHDKVVAVKDDGYTTLETHYKDEDAGSDTDPSEGNCLYASTVFGPTCDSIDVIARSVLLPKLKVGDWLYFQNMGAYTSAAASSFNGFTPTEKFYVCSVQPEYFEQIIAGPPEYMQGSEEKKDDVF